MGIMYFPFNVSHLLVICEQDFRCSQVKQFSGTFTVGGGGLGTSWVFCFFLVFVWSLSFIFFFSYIYRSCTELTLNIWENKKN